MTSTALSGRPTPADDEARTSRRLVRLRRALRRNAREPRLRCRVKG